MYVHHKIPIFEFQASIKKHKSNLSANLIPICEKLVSLPEKTTKQEEDDVQENPIVPKQKMLSFVTDLEIFAK